MHAREIEAEEAHHQPPCSAREREREASCVVCVGEGD
jgi:hypothetical protein